MVSQSTRRELRKTTPTDGSRLPSRASPASWRCLSWSGQTEIACLSQCGKARKRWKRLEREPTRPRCCQANMVKTAQAPIRWKSAKYVTTSLPRRLPGVNNLVEERAEHNAKDTMCRQLAKNQQRAPVIRSDSRTACGCAWKLDKSVINVRLNSKSPKCTDTSSRWR